MKLRENSFLTAIRAGQKQLGLWVSLSNGYAAEVVAHAGYDWVMLDMEHAPSDMASVLGQLQAFSGSETTAMVRPDWNDAVKVKRLMDLGAPGLLFPMVQTPDEARAAGRQDRLRRRLERTIRRKHGVFRPPLRRPNVHL